MYPIIDISCDIINAFFFPIFLDIKVITGITRKEVIKAPTDP